MAVRKNFKLFKYEHNMYSFEAHYFREMFKFSDFMNTLRNFAKSVFACDFAKFTSITQQFVLTESPDHVQTFREMFKFSNIMNISKKFRKICVCL